MPGVLHKYRGRVLLVVTGACPVHCRYCFRRHFPVRRSRAERRGDRPRARLRARRSVDPRGDPLRRRSAVARRRRARRSRGEARGDSAPAPPARPHALADRGAGSASTPRCSTGSGDRDCGRSSSFTATTRPRSTARSRRALAALRDRGPTLLNQSVLLRGVNDSADALSRCPRRSYEAGVLPYYLHLLDPVEGAAHFEVGEARGARAGSLGRGSPARLSGAEAGARGGGETGEDGARGGLRSGHSTEDDIVG